MDVYIFGAGASAAEGAPATGGFLPAAWRLLNPDSDRRVRSVWRFLEWLGERPIHCAADFACLPAVDQLFSLVDWSLQSDRGLGPAYDPARLRQVRRDLEHLVAATLAASLCGQAGAEAEGPHHRFARRLAQRPVHLPYALISLNYDTLLDEAVGRAVAPPQYGFGECTRTDPPGPLLLKLHGSLNWFHCKACDRVGAASGGIAHLLPAAGGLHCPECGSRRLDGLLVSPTLLKQALPLPLRRVWDRAFHALRRATRLIFVGYSLPPADVAILHLLQRALLTRLGPQRPSVLVINHGERVVEHFRRLFGPAVQFDLSGFRGQDGAPERHGLDL